MSAGTFDMDGESARVSYRCNICGTANNSRMRDLGRENPDCVGCGSTVRMRAMIALLSQELFGAVHCINDFPESPVLRGLGLSDWDVYARRLASRLDYTNTFYHQEPRLDITSVPPELAGQYDFLINSDVFEHVLAPVSCAFSGARHLLKPGGVLVMSVPYQLEGQATLEHFPDLNDWHLEQRGDADWWLVDTDSNGKRREFTGLVFHGGPGSTLEMRLFCRDSLLAELHAAGFHDIRIASEPIPEAGVYWHHDWSLPVVARA